jgi:Ca2+-binding EF-hand superfamily protein
MPRNKLILAAISSVLIVGAAAGTSLAAPHDKKHHPPGPHPAMGTMMGAPRMAAMREIIFVRMLQQFDANKDGQISKQEAKDGMEAIFVAIDTDKDGSLTPGEIRKYREAQMAKAKAPADDTADDNGAPMAPPADADSVQPAPPAGGANGGPHRGGMERGGMMRGMIMMQRIDTDENGQISKQEAEAAFDKFFTWMDRNKDGTISIADMPDRPFP